MPLDTVNTVYNQSYPVTSRAVRHKTTPEDWRLSTKRTMATEAYFDRSAFHRISPTV